MTTSADTAASSPVTSTRPSTRRRAALVGTGLLALLLPAAWGISSLVELFTGAEAEHRFHQITGQGVVLALVWASGPVALLVAGWRGRRPAAWAGLAHLAFVVATVVTVSFVPGDGVLFVGGIVPVTAALLWWALPQRPAVRDAFTGLDPVLSPVALLAAALYAPYVLSQRHLQATKHDSHAKMTHYFDMAWLGIVIVALLLVAAVAGSALPLTRLAGGASLVVGVSGLLLEHDTSWFRLAIVLGAVSVAAGELRSRGSQSVAEPDAAA